MDIAFVKETSGASIKEGSKPKLSVGSYSTITPNTANDGFSIDFGNGSPIRNYSLNGNRILVNTVNKTSLGAEAICDLLRDEVFIKPTSGNGGAPADLSNYYTKSEIDGRLSNVITA